MECDTKENESHGGNASEYMCKNCSSSSDTSGCRLNFRINYGMSLMQALQYDIFVCPWHYATTQNYRRFGIFNDISL